MLATARGELPSLPQIVLRMLDACDNDADYRDLGEIIGKDTALTARVLSLANSTYFRRAQPVTSLQHALLRLGTQNLKTLVITAALRQFLQKLGADQWQQLRDFWRHSLATALHARALANLTRYPQPDEAFLVGMLHNVGELLALKASTEGVDPQIEDHADQGARLAADWGLSPLAVDAIRYQQAAPESVRDADHLVKLINLATRLAMYDKRGVDAASTLFGLTAALTREIASRIDQEVESLANGLAIPLDGDSQAEEARQELITTLVQQGLIHEASGPVNRADQVQEFARALVAATEMLCEGKALVLFVDEEWLSAGAVSGWPELELRLPRDPALSIAARSAQAGENLWLETSEEEEALRVVDRQLLNLLDAAQLYVTPIKDREDSVLGLIVAGFETATAQESQPLLDMLARQVAGTLSRLVRPGERALEASDSDWEAQLRIRHLIHEVSNPLTIIRNYLGSLQQSLAEDPNAQADLNLVREELDRISELLLQARDLQDPEESEAGPVDLGAEVRGLVELLEGSFFAGHGIQHQLDVPDKPLPVQAPKGALRQVMLNLVRNAVEAMGEGGELRIRVRDGVWQVGRHWCELCLTDTGPGLPAAVRERLFRPVESQKGSGHSGLGLSIVKKLVDEMDGVISCHSTEEGTEFRILVPGAPELENPGPDRKRAKKR